MRWSQLKKQLHDRIAKSVVASIDLNQTRYRHSHDEEGEFWISFQGSRIFSTGSLSYLSSLAALTAKNRTDGSTPAQAYELAWPVMDASGLFLLEQMNKAMLNSITEHPLVQRLHKLRCEAEGVEAQTLS
jgi:hypothetical protein